MRWTTVPCTNFEKAQRKAAMLEEQKRCDNSKVRHWKTGGMDWKMTWRRHTVLMSNPDWLDGVLEFFIISALAVSWSVSTCQEGLKIVHSSCFLGPWWFLLLLFFLVSSSCFIFFLFLVFVSLFAAFLILLEQNQDFSVNFRQFVHKSQNMTHENLLIRASYQITI